MSGSRNSLSKAQVRAGDFHLRRDDRQMFGNYVELSPVGGSTARPRARQSATVVATPVYDVPKLWQIQLWFSAPSLTPVVPLSPWVPAGLNFDVIVTVTAALDRDKQTAEFSDLLSPIGFPARTTQNTYPRRFQAAHQLTVVVTVKGTQTEVLGVQASVTEVGTGARDAFGSAAINGLNNFEPFPQLATSQILLSPNEKRRQFFVQNWGSEPLFVAFDVLADGPSGGPPSWTFALPNRGDVYESPRDCWQGYVSGVFAAASATVTDFAMVTEAT